MKWFEPPMNGQTPFGSWIQGSGILTGYSVFFLKFWWGKGQNWVRHERGIWMLHATSETIYAFSLFWSGSGLIEKRWLGSWLSAGQWWWLCRMNKCSFKNQMLGQCTNLVLSRRLRQLLSYEKNCFQHHPGWEAVIGKCHMCNGRWRWKSPRLGLANSNSTRSH